VKFYVYAIRNLAGDRIYVGQCVDFERRFNEHNKGYVKSTKAHCPWMLVALQIVESRSEARWIEHELKKSRGNRLRWLREYAIVST
jgi:putative endonuclease